MDKKLLLSMTSVTALVAMVVVLAMVSVAIMNANATGTNSGSNTILNGAAGANVTTAPSTTINSTTSTTSTQSSTTSSANTTSSSPTTTIQAPTTPTGTVNQPATLAIPNDPYANITYINGSTDNNVQGTANVLEGQVVQLVINDAGATGGSGNYIYQWLETYNASQVPTPVNANSIAYDCGTGNSQSANMVTPCTFTTTITQLSSGTYNFALMVIDGSNPTDYVIDAAGFGLVIHVKTTVSPPFYTIINAGNSTFTGNATGGSGNYIFNWSVTGLTGPESGLTWTSSSYNSASTGTTANGLPFMTNTITLSHGETLGLDQNGNNFTLLDGNYSVTFTASDEVNASNTNSSTSKLVVDWYGGIKTVTGQNTTITYGSSTPLTVDFNWNPNNWQGNSITGQSDTFNVILVSSSTHFWNFQYWEGGGRLGTSDCTPDSSGDSATGGNFVANAITYYPSYGSPATPVVFSVSPTSNTFYCAEILDANTLEKEYTVTVNVPESSSNPSTLYYYSALVNVTKPLGVSVSLTPGNTLISAEQNPVTFTANAVGGTGNYLYRWTLPSNTLTEGLTVLNGCSATYSSSNTCQLSGLPGNYVINVEAKSNSLTANAVSSLQVTPDLVSTSFAANRTFISADQKISFTNSTAFGTGNNAYSYSVLPYTIYYTGYTDGGYGSGTFFRSNTPVSATYSDATLSEGYSGSAFNIGLTQTSSNGYDLGFYFDAGTLGSLVQNGFAITGTGNFAINLWLNVQDWNWASNGIYGGLGSDGSYGLGSVPGGQIITGYTKFDSFQGTICSGSHTVAELASGACPGIDANTPVAFWVGVGPLGSAGTVSASIPIHQQVSASGNNDYSTSGNTIQFNSAGNYFVTLTTHDQSGETTANTVEVAVTPPLFLSLVANRTYISADQAVMLSNSISGGTGNTVLSGYSVSPSTGFTQNGNVFTFNVPDTYTISMSASDATGETSSNSVEIQVTPQLTVSSFSANWTYISAGQSVKFGNTISGGTGNNVYNFSIGIVPANIPANIPSAVNSFTFNSYDNDFLWTAVQEGFAPATPFGNWSATPSGCYHQPVPGTGICASKPNGYSNLGESQDFGTVSILANNDLLTSIAGYPANVLNNVLLFNNTNGYNYTLYRTNLTIPVGAAAGPYTLPNPFPLQEYWSGTLTFNGVPSQSTFVEGNFTQWDFVNMPESASGTVLAQYPYAVFDMAANAWLVSFNVYLMRNSCDPLGCHQPSSYYNMTFPSYVGQIGTLPVLFLNGNGMVTNKGNGIYQFNVPGNYAAGLAVIDASGEAASSNLVSITVTPQLALTLSANRTAILTNDRVLFTNMTTGGTGNVVYTYAINRTSDWYSYDGSNVYTFIIQGNNNGQKYLVTLNAVDQTGETATSNVVITANETMTLNGTKILYPGIENALNTTLPVFSRDQMVADINKGANGGVPPYSYHWIMYLPGSNTPISLSSGTQPSLGSPVGTFSLNMYVPQFYWFASVFNKLPFGTTWSQCPLLSSNDVTSGLCTASAQAAGTWDTINSSDIYGNASQITVGPLGPFTLFDNNVLSAVPKFGAEILPNASVNFSETGKDYVGNVLFVDSGNGIWTTPSPQRTESWGKVGGSYVDFGYSLTTATLEFSGAPSANTFVSGTADTWSYTYPQYNNVSANPYEVYVPSQDAYLTLTGVWNMTSGKLTPEQGRNLILNTKLLPTYPSGPSTLLFQTNSSSPLGVYNIFLIGQDSTGPSSATQVGPEQFILNASLIIQSFTANRSYISADQGVTFSNVTTGGTGANVWTYGVISAPQGGFMVYNGMTNSAGSRIYNFTEPGNYVVQLYVKDISGENATANVPIQVTPPLETSLMANWTYISADQSVKFTNATTGGTGNTVFTYTLSPDTGFTYSGNNVYKFTQEGNYVVTLHVRDATGETNVSSNTIDVTPKLSTSLASNWSYISADQSVLFSNVTTGGTGNNVFTYAVSPGTLGTDYTVSGNVITFLTSNTYTVTLNVVDQTGETASASNVITVTPALETSLAANRTYISAEQAVQFSNTTTGGTGTNKFTFSFNDTSGITHQGDGNYVFSVPGNYLATLQVTDATNEIASNSVRIEVTPLLTTSMTANWSYISADQSVLFTNTTQFGTGNNVFTYAVSPGTLGTDYTVSGNVITFLTSNTYTVTLNVVDQTGETASASNVITVTPALQTQIGANWTYISAGQKVAFTNTSMYGTGNDVNAYTVSPGSNSVEYDIMGNVIQFNTQGNYLVTLTTTDQTGEVATSNTNIEVTPELQTSLTANWTYISADQSVKFTNATTGGTGNTVFTYSILPDSGFSYSGNNVYTFSTNNVYTVTLTATDMTGEVATSTNTITVTPALTIQSFTNTSRTYISAGQSVSFNSVVTGGTGNTIYTYFLNGNAVSLQAAPQLSVLSSNVLPFYGSEESNNPMTVSLALPSGAATYIFAGADGDVLIDSNSWTPTVTAPAGQCSPGIDGAPCTSIGTQTSDIGTVGIMTLNQSDEGVLAGIGINLPISDATIFTNNGVILGDSSPTSNSTLTYTVASDNSEVIIVTTAGYWGATTTLPSGCSIVTAAESSSGYANVTIAECIQPAGTYTVAMYPYNSQTSVAMAAYVFPGSNAILFPTQGNYIVTLGVRDATNEIANSTGINVDVTPELTTQIGANWTYISAGQKVAFTNTSMYGTGNDVNAYTVSPTSGTTVNGNVITFSQQGQYLVTLTTRDASGEVATDTVSIEVTPPLETSLTANMPYISADQSVKFTNDTTGGTGNTVYTYSVVPDTGFTQNSVNGNIFTFTQPGNYVVTLTVNDMTGEVATDSANVEVTPALTVNSFSVTTPISLDQYAIFTNDTTGGTGQNAFTYNVVSAPANGVIAGYYQGDHNMPKFSVPGNYVVELGVSDYSGETASNTVTVVVVPQLALAPLPDIAFDQGQSYTFTANAVYGTTPYTYAWTVGNGLTVNSGCTDGMTCNVLGSNIGNYTVSVTVTDDSAGTPPENATSTANVRVNAPLGVKPPISSHSSVDQGQLSVEQTSVYGGTPPYTTYWASEAPSNLTFTDISGSYQTRDSVITQYIFATNTSTQIGKWEFKVFVADNSIVPNMANAVNQEGVTVNPQLLAFAAASPIEIMRGDTSNVIGSTTGGTSTFNFLYQWFVKTPGNSTFTKLNGATSPTYMFVTNGATKNGTYLFRLQVTDTGTTVFYVTNSSPAPVTVGPYGVGLVASSDFIDSGQTDTLTATITGGLAPYSVAWNGPGGASACDTTTNSLVLTCNVMPTSAVPATLTYNVVVTDSLSHTQVGAESIGIQPLPTASMGVDRTVFDSGQTATFTITVIGGTGPFNIHLYNVSGNTITSYSALLLAPGTGAIQVPVNSMDANGLDLTYNAIISDEGTNPHYDFGTNSNTITVYPSLGSNVIAVPSAFDVGSSTNITATWSYGAWKSGYDYTFNVTNSSGDVIYVNSNSITPSGPYNVSNTVVFTAGANSLGTDIVQVTIHDITYNAMEPCVGQPGCEVLTTGFTVSNALSDSAVSITPSPSSVTEGSSETLSAIVSAGTAPYTYEWTYNGVQIGGNASTLTFYGNATTLSGSPNNVALEVSDASSNGLATTTVTVTSAPAPTTVPSGGGGGGGGGGASAPTVKPTVNNTNSTCILTNVTTGSTMVCTLHHETFTIGQNFITTAESGTSVNRNGYTLTGSSNTTSLLNTSEYSFYMKLLDINYYNYRVGAPTVDLELYAVAMQPVANVTANSTVSTTVSTTVPTTTTALPVTTAPTTVPTVPPSAAGLPPDAWYLIAVIVVIVGSLLAILLYYQRRRRGASGGRRR